jgi:serine/threonine protein kinase
LKSFGESDILEQRFNEEWGGHQMDNRTVINPVTSEDTQPICNATRVNSAVAQAGEKIQVGSILENKYQITKKFGSNSGEADLYYCQAEGQMYIAKIYLRANSMKDSVVEALKGIRSPNIAVPLESSVSDELRYEILPYYKNGSLSGKTYTDEELKYIIPQLNGALNTLHNAGILHKDLKPDNIMLQDNGRDVVLIDFGISSTVNQGRTVLVTKTGMTPEYSAPETFRGLYLEESDYYSLGVTLYELFCGHTPYQGMSAEEIARYTVIQRFPFPEDMPEDLKDLIRGLTYGDITNRNDKNNPNRRWTYEEVKKWCEGIKQPIPGSGFGSSAGIATPAYTFLNENYFEKSSLFTAFAEHWEEGKKQLFRGMISGFFMPYDTRIANLCAEAQEEAEKEPNKKDILFWQMLYQVNPEWKTFYWKNFKFASLPELGNVMLAKLWSGSTDAYPLWDDLLQNEVITRATAIFFPQNEELKTSAKALEAMYRTESRTRRDRMKIYYLMAYLLSGQRVLYMDKKMFGTADELAIYMQGQLDASFEKLDEFCHRLIDENGELDVQFEAWLIALGKREQLEAWRKTLER